MTMFERTAAPRSLPAMAASLDGKTMVSGALAPYVAEQYRTLAARLHHASEGASARVVMVASAMPGEGKTLTATNLALTLSESYGRHVLVIDTDLRRPSMHDIFSLPNDSGVNDLLMGHTAVAPVFEVSEHLSIIPAGRPNPDPLAGLTSVRLKGLLQQAVAEFDWVVVDTPPVGLLTDANLIARLMDAVVLVVSANKVGYKEVQRAADALGRERIIGVVLNRSAARPFGTHYGYDGYYGGYGPGRA